MSSMISAETTGTSTSDYPAKRMFTLPTVNFPDSGELISEQHSNDLLKFLHNLRETDSMCDYTLVVGDQRISVHRVVMMNCCEYFRALMTTDMAEKHDDSIALETVDEVGLRAIVDFAYTGKITLHKKNVYSVIEAASYLQVTEVITLCENYLIPIVDEKNACDLFNVANLYSLSKTLEHTKQFILKNFSSLSTEQCNVLPQGQLCLFLSDDKLKASSEVSLITVVKNWMLYNKSVDLNGTQTVRNFEEEPWTTLVELLGHIRWALIPGKNLVDLLDSDVKHVMCQIPQCVDWLIKAKDYHIYTERQPVLQSIHSRVRSTGESLVIFHSGTFNAVDLKTKNITWESSKCTTSFSSLSGSAAAMATINNFLFVCGSAETNTTSRFVRYDPRLNTWQDMPSTGVGRTNFVLLAHGHKLYALGGKRVSSTAAANQQECEVFDLATYKWTGIPVFQKHATRRAAACIINDIIYISGGTTVENDKLKCDLYIFDIESNKLEARASMKYARCDHMMSNIGNHIYVFGVSDNIEQYSIETDQWSVTSVETNLVSGGVQILGYYKDSDHDKIQLIRPCRHFPSKSSVAVVTKDGESLTVDSYDLPFVIDTGKVGVLQLPSVASGQ